MLATLLPSGGTVIGVALIASIALLGIMVAVVLVERRERRAILHSSYRMVTEGGKDGFFLFKPIWGQDGHLADLEIEDCNARGAAMIGAERAALIGRRKSTLWLPRDFWDMLTTYSLSEEQDYVDEEFRVGPGTPFEPDIEWIRRRVMRTPAGFAVAVSDITREQRLRWELLRAADEDLLTGLFNRNWLIRTLPDMLSRANARGRHPAVLFIDFDHFKKINDTLGFSVADEVLRAVAPRLESAAPDAKIVHPGGDKFFVLVEDIESEASVHRLAESIRDSCRAPFLTSRGQVHASVSVGVSVYPKDGSDADQLLRSADLAVHEAKAKGPGTIEYYRSALYESVKTKLELEQALAIGLRRGEIYLNYQPRVRANGGALAGLEALVRWRHPARGPVSPGEFIAIAEESGLIAPLGAEVLSQVCTDIAEWRSDGLPLVPVAVNVSAKQFALSKLDEILDEALAQHGLPHDCIELEITESVILEPDPPVRATLASLRSKGIKILVDDFGTGYSSLSQLHRLELDALKVDQSFVSGLGGLDEGEIIVNAIISMAHALGITVVAEGVETREQLRILQRLRCDEIQGYLISRPLAARETAAVLEEPDSLSSPILELGQES